MKTARDNWMFVGRAGVCLALLAWIFHVIFCNEAQRKLAGGPVRWESMSRWEQRRFAWENGPRQLLDMARRLDALSLALALAQCGALVVLGGMRWRATLAAQGIAMSIPEVTRISFVAQFFNAFLLGSSGGDVYKAVDASRSAPTRRAEAVLTVFMDRFVGMVALLGCSVAAAPWNFALLGSYKRYGWLAVAVTATFFASAALLAIGFYTRLLHHEGGLARVLRRFPKGESVVRALAGSRNFGTFAYLAQMALWSALINLFMVGTFYALARGLNMNLPFHLFAFVVPSIVFLSALPVTPSGLGVRENLFVYLLALPILGIKPSEALSLSLLGYSANLFWSIVGGGVYLFGAGHRPPEHQSRQSVHRDV